MRGLESAVEWLRPLVETKAWDYCVVWKLGDDPSRFIKWMDCCCCGGGGGGYGHSNVKVETGGEHHLPPFCRDVHFQHRIRTKACEALARFPSSMPLYSGIHGEVAISAQPRWLNHANVSDSNPSHESIGTQVLIPVIGGLIELFVSKRISEDQNIIEFVMAQCNVSLKQEAETVQSYTNASLNDHPLHPSLDECLQNWQPPLPYINFIPRLQFLPPVTQPSTYPSFEGSSTTSNPSNIENPSFDSGSGNLSPQASLKHSIGKSSGSKKPKYDENLSKQQMGLVLGGGNHVVEKDNVKVIRRPEREQYQSKNLVLERNRRNRIKDGLFALRAIVPKISKMDRVSILGDAAEYIGELQKKVKELQDDLKEMEEEDCNKNNAELKISKLNGVHGGGRYSPANKHKQVSSIVGEKKQMEVQVEVNQIGNRDFLLKFFCEEKRGGFARLVEAMNSLGVQVVDANVTTFNGKVLNILKVEANKEVQPKKLRDSLIKLTG